MSTDGGEAFEKNLKELMKEFECNVRECISHKDGYCIGKFPLVVCERDKGRTNEGKAEEAK